MTHFHCLPTAWNLRHWLLLAGLTLGCATAVMAQPAPGAVPDPTQAAPEPTAPSSAQQNAHNSFLRADVNGDGFLSREEAQTLPAVLEKFDQWDRDGDSKISIEEFLNGARAQGAQ